MAKAQGHSHLSMIEAQKNVLGYLLKQTNADESGTRTHATFVTRNMC